MIKLLPKRHSQVVMLRYGLGGQEAQAHSQIAGSLGVSEERSRQLEREALHRLRELGWRPAARCRRLTSRNQLAAVMGGPLKTAPLTR